MSTESMLSPPVFQLKFSIILYRKLPSFAEGQVAANLATLLRWDLNFQVTELLGLQLHTYQLLPCVLILLFKDPLLNSWILLHLTLLKLMYLRITFMLKEQLTLAGNCAGLDDSY